MRSGGRHYVYLMGGVRLVGLQSERNSELEVTSFRDHFTRPDIEYLLHSTPLTPYILLYRVLLVPLLMVRGALNCGCRIICMLLSFLFIWLRSGKIISLQYTIILQYNTTILSHHPDYFFCH